MCVCCFKTVSSSPSLLGIGCVAKITLNFLKRAKLGHWYMLLDCGVAFILCISKLDLFLAHSSYSLNVYVCVGWKYYLGTKEMKNNDI